MTSTNPRETVRRLVIVLAAFLIPPYARALDLGPVITGALALHLLVAGAGWALNPWVKAGER